MAKLDPELSLLLAKKAYHDKHPSAGMLPLSPDTSINIALKFTGEIEALQQAGFTLGSAIGHIAYGVTNLAGLEALAKHPQVEFIEKQRRSSIHLDKSVPDIKASQVWSRTGDDFFGYTGRDVIVGIIDTGIDFKHQSFRKADGTTRILKIWDQTLTAETAETIPGEITNVDIATTETPLGYGVEYDSDQINDTINGSTVAVTVRHVDEDGHGTHVAGIAVGDGSQSGTSTGGCHDSYHYVGVATEASLIVVRLWGLTTGDSDKPDTDNGVKIDAIRYIINEARNASKPVAINLSLGSFTEEMDGQSADCQAVDLLLTNNSEGTAIVFAAGNNGNSGFHANATVPAGPTDTLALNFKIHPEDETTRKFVIVYTGENLEIKLTSPVPDADGLIDFVASGESDFSITANGDASEVFITNEPNRIIVEITPPTDRTTTPPTVTGPNMAGEEWKIELRDTGSSETTFDAFWRGGSSHDKKSPIFLDHVTSRSTLDRDASGNECISVGSYKVGGRLAPSSGRGPTLDTPERTKPEICAPGVDIVSAGLPKDHAAATGCRQCCCECCQTFYVAKSGTSMAAPHITGVIALMLHKKPDLTHTDIKRLLIEHHTDKPDDSTTDEDLGWGAGKVNAKDVVEILSQVNPPVTRTMVEPAAQNFDALTDRLLATERGPELFRLFPRHFQEVMALINTNRRVAAVWHRCKGPIWVRLALRAAHTPGMALPLEVDGLRLMEGIWRFSAIVKKYASPAFIEDILRYEPELALLEEGMSLENLIDAVGNRSLPTNAEFPSDRSWNLDSARLS